VEWFSPAEWLACGATVLGFAALALPPTVAATALMRPSPAPLDLTGGGVDPWGVFTPTGMTGGRARGHPFSGGGEAPWGSESSMVVPPHLFPSGFAASRWVGAGDQRGGRGRAGSGSSQDVARDALGVAALFAAHVGSGAACCALLRCCGGGGGRSPHVGSIILQVGAIGECWLSAVKYANNGSPKP
jgi:hypothetical protein